MIRFTIPEDRFPFRVTPVRTSLGIVEFVDQTAYIDDAELAAALREVPAVFGIVEHGGPPPTSPASPPAAAPAESGEQRPSVRAPKADWVVYAARVHNVPVEEAERMNKADLIKAYGRG